VNIAVMQTVRLKGTVTAEAVTAATGVGEAAGALQSLVSSGDLQEREGRYRLTRQGRDRLDDRLAQERTGLDTDALGETYAQFTPLNRELKALTGRWQMRADEPNDHTDAGYDAAIIAELVRLDERFMPLLDRILQLSPPRMAGYRARFAAALQRVGEGDHRWLLGAMIDSYHTVWFELHQELFGVLGRSRVDEEAQEVHAL
jgi:hypothetical protein